MKEGDSSTTKKRSLSSAFQKELLPQWLLKKNRIIKGGEQSILAQFLVIILSIVIERKWKLTIHISNKGWMLLVSVIESLRAFVKAIVKVFGNWYLRASNEADICRLLSIGEQHGFPGMLGSIDCMHWKLEKCLIAWYGMYIDHCREPTIILEVVASQDLWIWHAFFEMPGSLNDINVLDRSPIFVALAEGCTAPVNYTLMDMNIQ